MGNDDNGKITFVIEPPAKEFMVKPPKMMGVKKSPVERIIQGETYITVNEHTDEKIKECKRKERKLFKISLYVFYAVMIALAFYWVVGVPKLLQILLMG